MKKGNVPYLEDPKERAKRTTIYLTAIIGSILFVMGIALMLITPNIGTLLLLTSLAIGVVPSVAINYVQYKRLSNIEEKFPAFMRSLAENKKSGATFQQSLELANKTNYGALSEEIRKTTAQVSWGMPFHKALLKMGERLKKSKVINQALVIINEAFLSGGDIAGIMDSISLNMNTIKDVYEERKSMFSQQALIMYFIFFMFLGISAVLYKVLIPIISTEGLAGGGGGLLGISSVSQEQYCAAASFICALGEGFGFAAEGLYFQTLFFLMGISQAIAIGLIAGYISTGRLSAGIKHAAVMLASTFIVFTLFI